MISYFCVPVPYNEMLAHCAGALVVAGALSVAKSYPTSEVRGSGLECQSVMVQEWLRGTTLRPRPGMAPEARGGGRKK